MLQSSILESLKATDEEKARKSFTKSVEASLDPLHSNRNISIRGNSYGWFPVHTREKEREREREFFNYTRR